MKKKRISTFLGILLAILVLGALAGTGYVVLSRVAEQKGTAILPLLDPPPAPTDEARLWLETQRPVHTASSPAGLILADAMDRAWDCRMLGEPVVTGENASQEAEICTLDLEAFCGGLTEEMQALLAEKVGQAGRRAQVYGADGAYLPELLDEVLCGALTQRAENPEAFTVTQRVEVSLRYLDESWQVEGSSPLPAAEAVDPEALAAELTERCAPAMEILPLHYAIPEDVQSVPAPPEENFHVSSDPAEIAALLDSPEARSLIGDQQLVWNPDLDFLEDSEIRLYLDETLLVIQWQQVEVRPVGTFAEIIIADGSQLRRKIAGDSFGSSDFMTTSGYAKDCNAVLALGGDYYWHHQRACGITVLDREICRFHPHNADSCFFNSDGDMIFVYRHAYDDDQQAEAQRFVDDNDVVFSLAFGPVLIDEGQDVTPEWYQWGEIHDTYARSALGMLGPKHYLSVNLNCTNAHYYLATLQDATDALMKRGCVKAYTLDGGQTATTVFHGELVNPVQFGWEKPISDIIYFASALPEE